MTAGWLVALAVLIFTTTALFMWALARVAADADRTIERIHEQEGRQS